MSNDKSCFTGFVFRTDRCDANNEAWSPDVKITVPEDGIPLMFDREIVGYLSPNDVECVHDSEGNLLYVTAVSSVIMELLAQPVIEEEEE